MATSLHSNGREAQQGAQRLSPPPSSGLKRLSDWWFRLTAPQEPENPTFAQREAARRGRLASLTILFVSFFTLVPVPNVIIHENVGFLVVLLLTIVVNAFALFVLNRMGYLTAAGWLVVTVLDGGFALGLTAIPHGVSIGILPAFDLLAESIMVVVAFFKPRSVFIVMTINIIFIILWLCYGEHTAEIAHLLVADPYNLFYPPISLELFEAVLAFVWVGSATRAIAALDRSEEIINLERRELEHQEQQLQLKQQLEDGIQKILHTHVKAANGEFTARAPLNKDNVLWQIAYSLNNLLARLQRLSSAEYELQRAKEATAQLVEAIHHAKAGRQPLQIGRTGTYLDPLILELTGGTSGLSSSQPSQGASPSLPSVTSAPPSSPTVPGFARRVEKAGLY